MKGYVQVYTGNGKGKTTAALGLILRACGARLRVYLIQFMKQGRTCEIQTLRRRFPEVTVRQCGHGCFIRGRPSAEAMACAARGFAALQRALKSRRYDVIVADEINTAIHVGLVPLADVLRLLDEKPETVELILTGRRAHPRLIRKADLVTEMRERKHYFRKGVPARPGIEM